MKPTLFGLFLIAGAMTFLLAGCGNSSSTQDTKSSSTQTPAQPLAPAPAATPAPAAAQAPAAPPAQAAAPASTQAPIPSTPDATPVAAAPVPTAAAAPSAATPPDVSAATSQLAAAAKSQNDQVLSSVGTDLADKVNALAQTAPANSAVNSQLTSSVQSLAAGKDASALGSFYQAVQSASLTPQQTQLAKEVGNLATAYAVQRNFSNLEGSQGDVATIVSSLRKGELTATVPALQKVAQNANLTSQQKDLLGSIGEKYAPGLTKAAGTLQQGLQGLRGLTK